MTMVPVSFVSDPIESSHIVIGVAEGGVLPADVAAWDVSGFIAFSVTSQKFEGKIGSSLVLPLPQGLPYATAALVGTGKPEDRKASKVEEIGGAVASLAKAFKTKTVLVTLGDLSGEKLSTTQGVARAAFGAILKSWEFKKYKTQKKDAEKESVESIAFLTSDASVCESDFSPLKALAEGVLMTRNIVEEPANVIYPESFVEKAQELISLGVKVEALDEAQMEELGMNTLLAVGHGSERESRLLVMQWNGGGDEAPVAFVGKGVTFDTGGISIKPSDGMDAMKMDMAGAGSVLGLMKTLALRKAKVNVVGVAGLVENMPSGAAVRPGDIVKSMSGQTVEILNTDAEGRLVLADALWYTQDRFKPKAMIDLATLTGAIIICLGYDMAGLFSNDETLVSQLMVSAEETQEKLWRMPLSPLNELFDKHIDSDIADMKNLGLPRQAGSTAAAQFLQRFVNNTPWVHLDISGVEDATRPHALGPKGATGFGVRLLNDFLMKNYEQA